MSSFPDAPRPFVDLSTGISPYPYPFWIPDASILTRLPEPEEESALCQAAAEAYGVADPALVAAGPGTQILIGLLPHVLRREAVTIWGPTYSGHEKGWRQAGKVVRIVQTQDAFEKAATAGDVCVLCNPNNPDGRMIDHARVLGMADRCAVAGGYLIVDEAFADMVDDVSVAGALPHPALIVLRSFGKSYGLPGMRLGFLLAKAELARSVRELMGPWAVGTCALHAGRQALTDRRWLEDRRLRLLEDRDRLRRVFVQAGLVILGEGPLFILVGCDKAQDLWRHLCKAGIVTRAFPERPNQLRFGVPAGEGFQEGVWERIAQSLHQWNAGRSADD